MSAAAALPIDAILPALVTALRAHGRAVLHAPPGAGKTTRVPLALLDAGIAGGRIIMLEPRRIAARAAAHYMARLLGESAGQTVGYRIRMDSQVGPDTRIEIVTEGVLTRMLQDDPGLDGVGTVIFDEFHERSVHADTALALLLQSRALLRPDVRLLVMSATLDTDAVAALLDDAPVIRSEGRAHPVETVYLERAVDGHIEPAVAAVTARAHDRHDGDILVFLPGAAEIRRTAERLAGMGLPASTHVIPLSGDLPQSEQDRAIAPSPPGRRKIVLATAVAETSITIEGVRTVVDSGLMRVPRFAPRTGMTRLVTVPVSRAAAAQRRGRAGRTGPGICYRMWTEAADAALLEQRPPEILEADLAPLALELAAWGVADPSELRWLDPPPAAAFAQAHELLRELDAIDDAGRLTPHGTRMTRLAAHPRLAHMLLRAHTIGQDALACDIAALLGERDVLRADDGQPDPDIRIRLPLLRADTRAPLGHAIDRGALHRARAEARHWRRLLRVRDADRRHHVEADAVVPLLLAFAYPDRIAARRGARGGFVLRSGAGALVDARHGMAGADMIVAADLGGHGRSARVFLGAPIERAIVEEHFAGAIETEASTEYDADSGSIRARRSRRLGAITLSDHVSRDVPPDQLAAAAADALRRHGPAILPWPEEAVRLRERLAFLHAHDPAWPDVSDDALSAHPDEWLVPWLTPGGISAFDTVAALTALVGWERRAEIDRLAPSHIEVPSGSRIRIDYSDPSAPVLAVRLQEMFGSAHTPHIAGGRVPLTLHLLSPAQRPVQVTRDLAGFWENTYFDVRKDLRGRYPKHYWPDDPRTAEATRRTRPR